MTSDRELDHWLRRRLLPPASADFERRIARAARGMPQRQPLLAWLARLFVEFHLPRPAYAMALVLLIGYTAGLAAAAFPGAEPEETASLQQFLYAEENIL